MPYPFLSDQWVAEARRIRAELGGEESTPPLSIRMNQVITDVPFGDGTVLAHLDTSSGTYELDLGHLPEPDLTVTLDYATAKAVLVDGDPQSAMAAFLGGRIKVDGDITKLLALQAGDPAGSGFPGGPRTPGGAGGQGGGGTPGGGGQGGGGIPGGGGDHAGAEGRLLEAYRRIQAITA